ncbi:uncharacterized protein LOC133722949 [Rosa rugosa]|uniref:uncharacterized protein LOC133722949 n=1 Tax=Rosa rugosa TaxID=74645 RepID=UPI002B4068C6|nr:uncharacterized protein LOC133722949 [Rosa rugosa]
MQNAINKDFGMSLGYQMCYRARMKAKKLAQGSYEDQYNLLESYVHELKKRNPGTSVWIQTELDGEIVRFKRIYICIASLKMGWREGCRLYIGLDGCHLKTVHKGQLLSTVGIEGNNGIYPIAWVIVEAESRESWTWFLEFLKADLDIHHSGHYTFMSDKQKGLEQAIKELFPDASHRHCVRHLHNNFKTDEHTGLELKQKLWAVARSCTMNTFMEAMEDLKNSSLSGWQYWCLDRPAIHWSKSHFDHKFKWDVSGLPCGHAIAAIYSKGMTSDDFVDAFYSKDMYMKAYEPIMHPITGAKEWEKINKPIAPPLYRRQPWRPKTARTKEPGEVVPPPGLTKLPKVYYSQVSCGICKQKGHNKRTCLNRNQAQAQQNVQPQAADPM